MRMLRMAHLYLGCLLTPTLIFFCVTGGLQAYGWHHSRKDGRYEAPRWIQTSASAHTQTPSSKAGQSPGFRWWMAFSGLGIVASSLLGVLMALQYTARRVTVWLCLAAGVLVPVALLVAGSPAFLR